MGVEHYWKVLNQIPSEPIALGRKGQNFEVGIENPRRIYLGGYGGMTLYLDMDECYLLRDWLDRALP